MPSTTAPIRAAASGSTTAVCPQKVEDPCGEGEDKLTLIVSPTGFKHTGVFPEQAVNWAWYAKKIRAAGRPIKVLNLFGYTGGATLACAAAGATVCHVDASKGIVAWGKDNAAASGLADQPIRWLVDDCAKFVAREKRRGNTYDGIIMDPPSYGRGPGGEIWKLEDCIYDLISQCEAGAERQAALLCRQQLHHRPVARRHGVYAQDDAGAPLWRQDQLR